MHCPECGQDLHATAAGAPCPECGTPSTLRERDPGPIPSPGRLLVRFGWPTMVGLGLVALASVSASAGASSGGGLVVTAMVAAVVFLIVGPINSANQARRLMHRLPRRTRSAPMLALIPRSVLVPMLAALATVPVNVAIGFGACLGAITLGVR